MTLLRTYRLASHPIIRESEAMSSYVNISFNNLSQNIIQLAIILASLQIFDGYLTFQAIQEYGIHAEGNSFLRNLMYFWGAAPVLLLVKSYSILLVLILCKLSCLIEWIQKAFEYIIYAYLALAIFPWTAIILIRSLTQ